MTDAEVIDTVREALLITIQISLPVLLVGLLVGVTIALIQALTQVQEITLVFVPKIVAIFLSLFFFLPFMMNTLVEFMHTLADKMIGGTGADRFYFTTNLNRNIDRIADFAPGQDKIYLSDAIFTEAGPARQALSADAFVTSASGIPALDSSDRIIYDSSNGNLYYDPDGSGSADAIQFARLLNTAAISADDFMIV